MFAPVLYPCSKPRAVPRLVGLLSSPARMALAKKSIELNAGATKMRSTASAMVVRRTILRQRQWRSHPWARRGAADKLYSVGQIHDQCRLSTVSRELRPMCGHSIHFHNRDGSRNRQSQVTAPARSTAVRPFVPPESESPKGRDCRAWFVNPIARTQVVGSCWQSPAMRLVSPVTASLVSPVWDRSRHLLANRNPNVPQQVTVPVRREHL